jgi:iron(III) transport system permease protein
MTDAAVRIAATVPAAPARGHRGLAGRVWVAALLLLLTALVLYPLFMLLLGAMSHVGPLSPEFSIWAVNLERLYAVATHSTAQRALMNSFITCGLGTVFALIIGLFFAWLTERTDTPGKKIIGVVGLFPLFVPPLVAAIAWSLLGSPRTGLLNTVIAATGLPFRLNMFSYEGIIFVFGVYYAPYVYLFAAAALRNMDASLEEAAAISGVGPMKTLFTITMPVIAPALGSAALLCFVVTLGVWGVPAILGTQAKIPAITTYIYTMFQGNPPDHAGAAAASIYLVLITGVGVLLQRWLHSSRNAVTVTGKSTRPRVMSLGGWKYVTLGVGILYLLIAVVIPMLALMFIAFRRFIFVASFEAMFDFSLFGLNNFQNLFANPYTMLSIWNSLIVGVTTAALGSVLCFALGYTIVRTRLPGRSALDVVATLPVAVPSLVIGISYLWAWIAIPIGLYGTLGILVLASLARYLPDAMKSMTGTLGQAHRELEEASWICGTGVLATIARIILPITWSGVAAAALLIFVLSIREYGATLFLYNNRTILMPLMLVQLIEVSTLGSVAAYSLLQVAVLIGLTLVGWMIAQAGKRIGTVRKTKPVNPEGANA